MRFTKMQGLGNDYLYVYGKIPPNVAELSQRLSDRHFGAGSDGMIFISQSDTADFGMRIFNADGSEAEMCGNGIRCVGKYVYDKKLTSKTTITVDTLSGIKELRLHVIGGEVTSATVDMGRAIASDDIELDVRGTRLSCTPVSVGNPHAVVFVEDAESMPVSTLGPLVEHHGAFPSGVNTEFVQVLSDRELRMRVWERGSGITMACGTGACAAVAAAARKGLCPHDSPIIVWLDGGSLEVSVSEGGHVTMTGPAVTVYEGEVSL